MNADQSLRLTCPKCAAKVRVAAHLAGKRLKCPKCSSPIKVPGVAPMGGDEEDWLGLDSPLAPQKAAAKANSPAAKDTQATDWLDDLPGLAPAEPRPAANLFGADLPPLSEAEISALSAAGGFLDGDETLPERRTGKRVEQSSGADVDTAGVTPTEYRAKCPICESVHYVKPKQAGKQINCGDCFSPFVVPPPPKVVPKKKMDITKAPSFQLAEVDASRASYEGPEAKSAAEYLRRAEDEDLQQEQKDEYETPDVGAWLKSMFGIFFDPSVLAYWIALSVLGAIPSVITVALGSPILQIGLGIAGVLYLLLVVACGFAIMESVSGGEKTVAEWPVFNPADWFGQTLVALSALALSAMPGALLGVMVFGVGLALLATTLMSIFLIFPFVILSMLDNGSVFMPISAEVTKSITRCKETWGGVYFSSMLLFGGYFVAVAMLSTLPPVVGLFVDCFLSVGLIFVYFSMLGGLAYQIGQAINGREQESD